MHNSLKRLLPLLFLPSLLVLASTSICFANAPPPPTIAIIVSHASKDLELSIGSEKSQRTDKIFESYYTFYLGFSGLNYNTLTVTQGGNTFEISLPQLRQYNNIFTLDLGKRTLTPGASWWRPYQFAGLTLILTLLIEGVIFFLFGYRKRNSWIVFLVTNVVTQGFLYASLNKEFYPLVNSYNFPVILSLIGEEFLVFIFETAAFLIFIREHRWFRTLGYVILANLASLVAGGFIISALI